MSEFYLRLSEPYFSLREKNIKIKPLLSEIWIIK